MFNRFSQFKETISQELNGGKDDSVHQIEKNATILKTETPSAEKMDFFNNQSNQDTGAGAGAGAGEGSAHEQDEKELELEAKLKKFAKYEEKYPQLLKAYRLEKKKGELVKVYEQILSEHTPVSSIAEPRELVSFIDGLNQRGTLIKQELDRISDSFSRLRKKNTATTEDLDAAKKRISSLEEELKTLEAKVTELEEIEQKYAELEVQTRAIAKEGDNKDLESQNELKEAQVKLEKLELTTKERDEALARIVKLQEEMNQLTKQKEETVAISNGLTADNSTEILQEAQKVPPSTNSGKKKKKKKGGQAKNEMTEVKQADAEPAEKSVLTPVHRENIDELSAEVTALDTKLKEYEAKIKELTDILETKQAQIEDLEASLSKFKIELPQLHMKIGDLEREAKSMSSKNAELSKAKESLEKSMENIKREQGDVEEKIKRGLNAELKEKEAELQRARQDQGRMEALEIDLVEQKKSASNAQHRIKVLESERNELTGKLQSMSSRFSTAESEASSAKISQESLVRQLEEARLRMSEATTKIDLMQDEVNDAHRQAQERLQETIVMRSLINDRQGDRDLSLTEAQRTIASLRAERDQLELDAESISRRLIRDTEPLKREIADLEEQVRDAKAQLGSAAEKPSVNGEHSQEDVQRSKSKMLSDNSNELEKLRASLEQALLEAREATRANKLLKHASEDTQERIQRLQKANIALTDELEQAQTTVTSRRSSIAESPSNEDQKNAYTKNVLLGFLEHKEQRKQLMPVLATLLQFEPGDEQRVWGSL